MTLTMPANIHPKSDGATAFPVVAKLLERLVEAGYFPVSVDLDEDDVEPTLTAQDAIEAIYSVDYSTLRVRKNCGAERWIFLILCNGLDVISDFGAGDPELEAVIDKVIEEIVW
jgi:hypothetical protein